MREVDTAVAPQHIDVACRAAASRSNIDVVVAGGRGGLRLPVLAIAGVVNRAAEVNRERVGIVVATTSRIGEDYRLELTAGDGRIVGLLGPVDQVEVNGPGERRQIRQRQRRFQLAATRCSFSRPVR